MGDGGSDGDGAYRLLGSLTTATQLTSEMLAETLWEALGRVSVTSRACFMREDR
jgi:hypothetical protein